MQVIQTQECSAYSRRLQPVLSPHLQGKGTMTPQHQGAVSCVEPSDKRVGGGRGVVTVPEEVEVQQTGTKEAQTLQLCSGDRRGTTATDQTSQLSADGLKPLL